MPDPFEELESFKQQGLPVTPLPAPEVRRRGDRLRRRNNTLTALGTLAAATVLVATPLAIADDGGSRSDDPVAPASRTTEPDGEGGAWRSSVPSSFPLTHGMPETNAHDGSPVKAHDGYRKQVGVAPCGGDDLEVDRPETIVDSKTAVYTETEGGGIERNLLLYADADAAASVIDHFAERFDDSCPAPADGPESVLQPSDLGDASLVYVDQQRFEGELTGGTLHALVQVGNAVFHHAEWVGSAEDVVVRDALNRMLSDSAYPVASMCIFAADPCTEPPGAPGDPAAAAPIPDGFPLTDGLPDGDQTIGPAPDAGGIDLSAMCGTMRDVWPADYADRLAVTVTTGDYLRTRELVTFESPETAGAVLDGLRAAVENCGRTDMDGDDAGPQDLYYMLIDDGTDTGSLSFAMTTASAPVAAVHRFVVAGGAVLGSYVSGDFTSAELDSRLGELVDQDAGVLEQLADLEG